MTLWWIFGGVLLLAVLAGAGRAWARRRSERRGRVEKFLAEVKGMGAALEAFDREQDFDEQIRLLATTVTHCRRARDLLTEYQAPLGDIIRACEEERIKLAQHNAVVEAEKYMAIVEQTANLKARGGRVEQVTQVLKLCSRYLFPHERITTAMRSTVSYYEKLKEVVNLPDAERPAAAEQALDLLQPYYAMLASMKEENQELARRPWPREMLREHLNRLEKAR